MRLGVTQHPAHGARTFLPGCKKQPARPSGPRPCSPLATIRKRGANGKLAASHPVILSALPVIPAPLSSFPRTRESATRSATTPVTPHHLIPAKAGIHPHCHSELPLYHSERSEESKDSVGRPHRNERTTISIPRTTKTTSEHLRHTQQPSNGGQGIRTENKYSIRAAGTAMAPAIATATTPTPVVTP